MASDERSERTLRVDQAPGKESTLVPTDHAMDITVISEGRNVHSRVPSIVSEITARENDGKERACELVQCWDDWRA